MTTTERFEPGASGAAALVRAAAALGLRGDARELSRAFDAALRDAPASDRDDGAGGGDALDSLGRAAAAAGLRASALELPLAEGIELAERGTPLLVRAGDAFAVLLGRRSRGVLLALHAEGSPPEERVVPEEELGALLGLPGDRPVRWLLLEGPEPEPQTPRTPETAHLPPLQRLLRLLRPDRGDILAVAVFAATVGVLLLATPLAVQALVNFAAVGGALPPLIVVVLLLGVGLAFAGALSATQAWIVEILQRRLFARMVADLAARLPRLAPEVYQRHYAPELVNRFFDIVTIQKTGSGLLLDGLSLVLSVVVGLVMLAFYHPLLLAFDIVLVAVIALVVLVPVRRGTRTAIEESKAKYEVAGWLEEIARHPILFRSFGVERWVFERSDRVAREYLERRAAHYRVLFSQIVGALALHALTSTALLGIGGLLVIGGSLTLGQLVAAELIVTLIVTSVAKLGKHLESYYDLMAASEKLGHLLDLPVEPAAEERRLRPVPGGPASLELRDLSLFGPGGAPLFEGVGARVPAGTSLGVRGPSGAGKSALLEVLWGLRRPDRGAVRLDGLDLRDLPPSELRRSAALVADVEVIAGSVRENVRLGREHVDEGVLRDALERVGLLEELEACPDGLDTRVNARGAPLSEGQVRRLQVARSIADPPRVLLLSDLFLQLSGAPRERLLDTLFDPRAGWTLVVVSNAEDVLARCDQVLELPGGAVAARTAESA